MDNIKTIALIKSSKSGYVLDHENDHTNEMAHFYFLGNYEGKQTVFNTFFYTLRMYHTSEMYEIAENMAARRFPGFVKLNADNELDDPENLNEMEEEIGVFMAETIFEIEEEETVKVKEHIDIDFTDKTEVCLDVGLNVEEVSEDTIVKFIREFNDSVIRLDETLHSFQHGI